MGRVKQIPIVLGKFTKKDELQLDTISNQTIMLAICILVIPLMIKGAFKLVVIS